VLLISRVPPEEHVAPEVMVVGAAPRGKTRVTTVSVWLGGVVERKLLPYAVKHLLQPSVVDHAGRRVLVLVDAEPSAHVLPETAEAAELLEKHAASMHFFEANYANNSVAGFGLFPTRDPYTFSSVALWEMPFAEKLMVHAVRGPAESVQSHVRILGDRSVLYKYLNPNTLFVATVPGDLPVGAESHLTARHRYGERQAAVPRAPPRRAGARARHILRKLGRLPLLECARPP